MRAAHRRWVVWRTVEHIGVSALASCTIALPIIAILWWRGESALTLVATLIAMGVLAGMVLGVLRRPTLAETAGEVDRQHGLHDLLGTAMRLPACPFLDESWRRSVRSLAEARCRTLSPSGVVVRRLGSRAWSGIGLSVALVLTLSLMTTSPARLKAGTGVDASRRVAPIGAHSDPQNVARPNRAASGSGRSRMGDVGGVPSDTTIPTVINETFGQAGAQNAQQAHAGDGAGSGSAATPARARKTELRPVGASDPRAPDGTIAGGGAGSGGEGSASDRPASDTVSMPSQRDVPPWQSAEWSLDRQRALESIQSNRIPDRYRDVVREYFKPAEH
jgi:hypothetical protein